MVINLYVYPSIAHHGACVDGLIHSLLCISWSCGSCIWLLTAQICCQQFSITVNVKCHCQWNPANQLPRTTGNIGRGWCKSSGVVWPWAHFTFSWWRCYKSNVESTAKNRALKFVSWSHIFHIHMSVNRPLFLHDSHVGVFFFFFLFFNYLHLLYKSGKHWANTHWIKFPKQQVVSVGFPLCRTDLFHYCVTVTWHTSDPWGGGGCKSILDEPNFTLTDCQVMLNVALLPLVS